MTPSLLLLAAALHPAAAGEIEALVGITNEVGSTTGTAVDIDLGSGAGTALGTLSRPGISLAYLPEADNLYVALPMGGGQNQLTVLDNRSYAEISAVGIITDVADGSTHKVSAMGAANGTLYGISRRRGTIGGFPVPEGLLVEIDPHTAEARTVGSLGIPVRARGGTVKDGAFYLVTNPERTEPEQKLYRVDLGTGAAALVGSTGVYGEAVGLTTGPDGELLAALSGDRSPGLASWDPTSRLYALDPGTGWATEIGSTGHAHISSLTYLRFPVYCGIVTARDLVLEGDTIIDSWDSALGPYAPAANARVCSNGSATIAAGITEIHGDVFWGRSVNVGGGALITGSVEPLVSPTPIPDVATAAVAANNDNAQVPELAGGALVLANGASLTLPAGIYYASHVSIGNRAQLHVDGPVELWVEGDITIGVDAVVNTSGVPTELTIRSAGATMTSTGTTYARLVAPYAAVTLDGLGNTYGTVLADQLLFNGQHAFHQDDAAANAN